MNVYDPMDSFKTKFFNQIWIRNKKKTTGNDELNKLRKLKILKKFSSLFHNILLHNTNPVNIQTEKKVLSKIILPKISQENNNHIPNKINKKIWFWRKWRH